jgi:RNA polymerase sigma factor (sigma-70 family)
MGRVTTESDLDRLLAEASWLRGLARSLLHHGPDADDAVQDVWVTSLRSPPDQGRPARPWLAEVLRNLVRSAARRSRFQRERAQDAAFLGGDRTVPPVDGVVERMQTQRLLAEQVMALAEPYRSTLLLRFYEGHTAVAIGRAQGVPAGTVRWRINEGLRQLRDRLDQLSGGDRARWNRSFVPLVLPRGRGLTLVGVCGIVAMATVGALWLRGTPTSSASDRRAPGERREGAQPSGAGTEEAKLRREKLKRAAVFFGVVVPALTAAGNEAALEDAVIAGCLEMAERSHECKDAFVDAILDRQLEKSGTTLTAAARAAVREARLRVYENGVTGPLEYRRERCRQTIEAMDPHAKTVAHAKQRPLRACYAEPDCTVRARCFVDVLDQIAGVSQPTGR